MKRNKPEILAPAGSIDALKAAVRCGADAVYFGGKAFNARRNADNFDDEELKNAVGICHTVGAKAHITLNTLVGDGELPAALDEIKRICASGADALILQDLGVTALAKKCAPQLLRHASTQMSVQTPAGVRLLREMGFSRAVLPRELSAAEIREINEKTDMETECFVHGALCMCLSGQCYMSALLGSRSGNRGLCAQPCRLPFSVEGGTGADLSLKDLSLVESIREMAALGVSSLKIEGRMKRPEYVAAAVTACVKSKAGGDCTEEMNDLRAVFSRSGFTDGYYRARLGREMFGIRRKEDVTAASAVLSSLSRLYDKQPPLVPVIFSLRAIKNEPLTLTARSEGYTARAEGAPVQTALSKPTTGDSLLEKLNKCGGTPFYMEDCVLEADEDIFLPASELNALRRETLSSLEEQMSRPPERIFRPTQIRIEPHKAKSPKLYAFFTRAEQIPSSLSGIDTVYVPYDTELSVMKRLKENGIRVGAAVPVGMFSLEKRVRERLTLLKENGFTLAYCGNLDSVAIARQVGMEIHTGSGLNIFNSLSLGVLSDLGVREATLSFELTLRQAERLGGEIKRGLIAYGRLPLMNVRNCPLKNGRTCAECDKNGFLTDRMGVKFPVRCSGACSVIYNSRPVWLADRLHEVKNMDFLTLYFTTENEKECAEVLRAYQSGSACRGEFTRGLYYRGVE